MKWTLGILGPNGLLDSSYVRGSGYGCAYVAKVALESITPKRKHLDPVCRRENATALPGTPKLGQ